MISQLQLYLPSGKLVHGAPFKHGFKLQAFPAGENIFKWNKPFYTVMCSVTWPLGKSEAGVDLVLIQTALLFSCKSCCF